MKQYVNTRAMERPNDVQAYDGIVLVADDIHEVTINDEVGTHTEYEYTLRVYTTSEYIQQITESNVRLENELIEMELALCEIYEMVGE